MRISDWSSDVCSSDLTALQVTSNHRTIRHFMRLAWTVVVATTAAYQTAKTWTPDLFTPPPRFNQPSNGTNPSFAGITGKRSEESRGGKECVSTCRFRWRADTKKKKKTKHKQH